MDWTREQKLKFLVERPWTVSIDRDGDDHVAHVSELPFLTAVGGSEREVSIDLYEGLSAALDALLAHDDAIPLPAGESLPWEHGIAPGNPTVAQSIHAELRGSAWVPSVFTVAYTDQLPIR